MPSNGGGDIDTFSIEPENQETLPKVCKRQVRKSGSRESRKRSRSGLQTGALRKGTSLDSSVKKEDRHKHREAKDIGKKSQE